MVATALHAFRRRQPADFGDGLDLGNHNSLRADYSGTNVTLVSEVVGIKVAPTSGLVTTEAGGTATFTVVIQ